MHPCSNVLILTLDLYGAVCIFLKNNSLIFPLISKHFLDNSFFLYIHVGIETVKKINRVTYGKHG